MQAFGIHDCRSLDLLVLSWASDLTTKIRKEGIPGEGRHDLEAPFDESGRDTKKVVMGGVLCSLASLGPFLSELGYY